MAANHWRKVRKLKYAGQQSIVTACQQFQKLQVHTVDQTVLPPLWSSFIGTGIHNGPVPPALKLDNKAVYKFRKSLRNRGWPPHTHTHTHTHKNTHWAHSAKNGWKSSVNIWLCLFRIVPVHKNCLYQKQPWQSCHHISSIFGFQDSVDQAAEIPSLQDAVSSLQAHLQHWRWGASKTMSPLDQHGIAAFLWIKAHLLVSRSVNQ